MALADDSPRILAAIREIDGVCAGTDWSKQDQSEIYVLITLAGDRTLDYRDDADYLTELEYYVRVFSGKADLMRSACAAVHEKMEGLGYQKTFRYEESGEGKRQTVFRYRRTWTNDEEEQDYG